jgi:hypothetical protein
MPGYGAPAGGQYEFSAHENEVIDKLAGRLTIAGIMQIVFGGLQLLGGWSFGLPGYFVGLPGSLALIVIGALFVSAAGSFRSVTQTRGYDIQHLMGALGKLHTAATVQIVAYIVAVLLGILIGIIMMIFFAALLAGLG